jgi:hypothetical protein
MLLSTIYQTGFMVSGSLVTIEKIQQEIFWQSYVVEHYEATVKHFGKAAEAGLL